MLHINNFKAQVSLGIAFDVVVRFYLHSLLMISIMWKPPPRTYPPFSNLCPNLTFLSNHFNNSSPEENTSPENVVNFRYFNIDQILSLEFTDKEKCLSSILINVQWTKNWWSYLLTKMREKKHLVSVSETKITAKTYLACNMFE